MPRTYFYSKVLCALSLLAGVPGLHADSPKPFDAAAAFGARTDVEGLRLSPDRSAVSLVTPIFSRPDVDLNSLQSDAFLRHPFGMNP